MIVGSEKELRCPSCDLIHIHIHDPQKWTEVTQGKSMHSMTQMYCNEAKSKLKWRVNVLYHSGRKTTSLWYSKWDFLTVAVRRAVFHTIWLITWLITWVCLADYCSATKYCIFGPRHMLIIYILYSCTGIYNVLRCAWSKENQRPLILCTIKPTCVMCFRGTHACLWGTVERG